MPVQKKVAITGAILLVTGTLVVWTVVRGLFAGDPFSSTTRIDPPPTSLPTRPDPPRPAGALAQLEAELREGGWQREERMAFVAISGDWFEILHAEARPYFEDQMKALARLGGHRKALKLVRSNPEFAGLLALADHPNDLAEILDSADANARQTLIGLFARCADRHDLNDLVAALADKAHRDYVAKMAGPLNFKFTATILWGAKCWQEENSVNIKFLGHNVVDAANVKSQRNGTTDLTGDWTASLNDDIIFGADIRATSGNFIFSKSNQGSSRDEVFPVHAMRGQGKVVNLDKFDNRIKLVIDEDSLPKDPGLPAWRKP